MADLSAGGASVVCLHGLGRTPSDWEAVRPSLGRYGIVRTPRLRKRPVDALACAGAVIAAGDVVVGPPAAGRYRLTFVLDDSNDQPVSQLPAALTVPAATPADPGGGRAGS